MSNYLIVNAKELVTVSGFAGKCGEEMQDIGVILNGALYLADGKIMDVGTSEEVQNRLLDQGITPKDYILVDAENKVVMPGFIDSHTHFVFGGYRDDEYVLRLQGVKYSELMDEGGIRRTVSSTRKASFEELYDSGYKRLQQMLMMGITTVEGKSGYGLDLETELKQLDVMEKLNQMHPIQIVKTYMGAHELAPEFEGCPDQYIDFLIKKGLPLAKGKAKFCDIFTEVGVFDHNQTRRLLHKAEEMGFQLKMHADEMVPYGGAELAAELKTVSVDHLLNISDNGIQKLKQSGTIATLLPNTAFSLREKYAPARRMIDAGLPVALASDMNPGSCYSQSIPLIIALATIEMKMTIEETITALTLNGAAALDLADVTGSLDIGKKADVIIIDAPSYKHLAYHFTMNLVESVFIQGNLKYTRKIGP